MFDADWPDADDKLGGHQVTTGPMGIGGTQELVLSFTGDGAHYTLYFQLTRIN